MKPIDFPQSTKELGRPRTMTDDECGSLHVWSDGRQCVSCWNPTLKERVRILFGRPVWLGVVSGNTQPPVFVRADRNVFEPEQPIHNKIIVNMKIFFADLRDVWKSIVEGFKQPDKRKHMMYGFVISLIVGIVNPWLGFAVGCIAGAVKEWWDSAGHGSVELADFIFTCIGAAVAIPFAFVLYNIVREVIFAW